MQSIVIKARLNLVGVFNLTCGSRGYRLSEVRRIARLNLTARPQGKGNKAWKRLRDMRAGTYDGGNFILYP